MTVPIMVDFYVNKNGSEVNIKDVTSVQGLDFLDMKVSAPNLTGSYQATPGLDGELDLGATYGARTIQANFYFEGTDLYDFELACRSLWSFFFERDPYYIRSGFNPGIRYYVRPKPYDPSRISVSQMTFTIEFDLLSGFGESLGTTQDPFTYDAELWQAGQHLPDGQDLSYTFTENNFSVYNAGDITIDPIQHHELKITITCDGKPIITNVSTGDMFSMNSDISKTDTLTIDGIYPYLNNVHCGRSTNHGIITLAKGWNQFSISGASNISISFLFRFLYM